MKHSIAQTALQTLRDMRRGLNSAPKQGWRLAARDIRIEYVHTKLGLLWAFLEPLAIALVFIALRSNGAMEINGLVMPYSLFAVCGILIWQTFFDSLMMCLSSLERSSSLVGNYAVPPESLIFAMLYRGLFMLAMRLPIIIGLTAALGLSNFSGIAFFILMSPLAVLMGVALGLFLSPFTLASGDLKLAVGVIARPMLFLSGAIFPLTGSLEIFRHVNPVAVMIENLRSYLVNQQFPDAAAFTSVAICVVALFFAAWFAYHRTMRVFS